MQNVACFLQLDIWYHIIVLLCLALYRMDDINFWSPLIPLPSSVRTFFLIA